MRTSSVEYQGRPIFFLLGFLTIWVLSRIIILTGSEEKETIGTKAGFAIVVDSRAVQNTIKRSGKRPGKINRAKAYMLQKPVDPESKHRLFFQIPEKAGRNVVLAKVLPGQAALKLHRTAVYRQAAIPSRSLNKHAASPSSAPSLSPVPFLTPTMPGLFPSRDKQQRWSASAWVMWRSGRHEPRTISGLTIPQYGGSQVGGRIGYRLPVPIKAQAYVRASAPLLSSGGKELAVGMTMQPHPETALAVAIEQRVSVSKNGRNAPALLTYGGIGPRDVAGAIVEGYGQAGIVGLKKPILFAEGAVALRHTIPVETSIPIQLGAGIWGGIQEGAGRLDIGPTLLLDSSAFTSGSSRISIDWRQRVAGNAVPGSGVAVTLAQDF